MKSCGITCTGKCSKAAIIQAFWGKTRKTNAEGAEPLSQTCSLKFHWECSAPFCVGYWQFVTWTSRPKSCERAQFESTLSDFIGSKVRRMPLFNLSPHVTHRFSDRNFRQKRQEWQEEWEWILDHSHKIFWIWIPFENDSLPTLYVSRYVSSHTWMPQESTQVLLCAVLVYNYHWIHGGNTHCRNTLWIKEFLFECRQDSVPYLHLCIIYKCST